MLGTLAKWLRFTGYDTFYANATMDDRELMNIAKKEKRIIITRDKQLIQKSKKENLQVIEIKTTDLDKQLKHVLNNVDTKRAGILSRCSLCNTILQRIDKCDVKNRVPKKVFENNKEFWFCKKCNKIYWKGTHYTKIVRRIDAVKKATATKKQ